MTPLMTSWGPTRGMSFTASDTSTTWSPLSTPSLKSSKKSSFMAGPSSFLHGLVVHRLDVDAHPIPILSHRVFRHARLVLRSEMVGHVPLEVVERRSRGRPLLHRVDQVGQIAAEERQVRLGDDVAVTEDHVVEVELAEGVHRAHPVLRVAVVEERH